MIPAFPLLYSVPIAVKAHVPDGRVRAHHLVLMVASQRLTQLLTIPSTHLMGIFFPPLQVDGH